MKIIERHRERGITIGYKVRYNGKEKYVKANTLVKYAKVHPNCISNAILVGGKTFRIKADDEFKDIEHKTICQ